MAAVAMTPGVAMRKTCGAQTRRGSECGRDPGWGTDHVGFGYCKLHGGCTPQGKTYGARLKALAELGPMGGEVDVNPLDALLYTVRRGSGLAALYRLQAEAAAADGKDSAMFAKLEADALNDLARWAKMAIDAGVAERQVRIAERMGERLSAAFEAAIAAMVGAGVQLSGDQRMLAVRTYAAELARHEGGGAIEARSSDV